MREAVDEMTRQSLRAGQIIRHLREFVIRGETEKAPENIRLLVEEASALALMGSRDSGVRSVFEFAPDAGMVLVDRVQIQQVLINLMRNAIEAMEHSPVKSLSVVTSMVDGSTVQIAVRDSGPGIDPVVREHLFQAFNSSKEAGMGLGLSICRTIVEAHGGQIRALDRDDGGTEFQLTLVRAA
jgi:two-component system sensor kinase FixL